jgi:hypothetical protein
MSSRGDGFYMAKPVTLERLRKRLPVSVCAHNTWWDNLEEELNCSHGLSGKIYMGAVQL